MIDIIERTTDKTPIEVLLQVDNNGTVSAKNVYRFLELEPSNYSKWCKSKILENEFAEENADYVVFVLKDENPKGGRPTTDYKLTIAFAKKLCMKQGNKRGEEARNYFIKVEEKLKQVATNEALPTETKTVNNEIQALKTFFNVLEHHHNEISEIKEDIKLLKEHSPKEVIVEHTELKQETYFSKQNAYLTTSIAKAFNLSAVALNGILNKEGVIQKVKIHCRKANKQGTAWIITDTYRKQSYSLQKFYGVLNIQEREPVEIIYGWTPKGVGFIVELLKRNGFTQYSEIDNRTLARVINRRQSLL